MEPVYGNDPSEKSGITASAALWVAVILMIGLVAATILISGPKAMMRISDLGSPAPTPTSEP